MREAELIAAVRGSELARRRLVEVEVTVELGGLSDVGDADGDGIEPVQWHAAFSFARC
jgi:hypothetical protein